ncbi:MAG: nucleoside-triphosphatase [Firmicutes bacterium]|nr:nucleoside-triphosphatase [Bacillota bacterium]
MVSFVTGKINSGKTTFLLAKYLNQPIGDGVISLKTMKNGRVHRYDALHLSSNQETLLAIHELDLKDEVVACKIGPYCFLEKGLKFIENEIEKMIHHQVEPIYLDEIGVLELKEQGFYQILKKLVASKLDLVLSTREDLLEEVIRKFNIEEMEIVTEL